MGITLNARLGGFQILYLIVYILNPYATYQTPSKSKDFILKHQEKKLMKFREVRFFHWGEVAELSALCEINERIPPMCLQHRRWLQDRI